MKASAILCAILAGTFGFSTMASAQQWRGGDRDHDRGHRSEQRQDHRGEHREHREQWRHYQQPRYVEQHRHYGYGQPHYVYSQRGYRGEHRFYRGGYVPREYLRGPYFVSNWNAYPGLYAPPYGYQWVNADGQFLLVALATGLIANALINSY